MQGYPFGFLEIDSEINNVVTRPTKVRKPRDLDSNL
jgi:hypothetical protein